MYKVQSVLFNRNKYTPEIAVKWLVEKGFDVKKIDGTKSLWRFRQFSPAILRKEGFNHYRSHKITDDITFVLAYKD
jgi:hypothetical protein